MVDQLKHWNKTFTLPAHEYYTYITPAGEERSYIYALSKRTLGNKEFPSGSSLFPDGN